MSLAFLIYLISVLGNLEAAFVAILATGAAVFVLGLIFLPVLLHEDARKFIKYFCIVMILSATFKIILPSEKTAWMMVGGYVAQNVYESEAGDKLKKIVSNKLDQILEEQLDTAKEKK